MKNIKGNMEDITGALEVVSMKEEVRNSFLKDNRELIFGGSLGGASCPKHESKSISIAVSAFINAKGEGESQIESIRESVSAKGCNEEGGYMIAIHTGKLLKVGRAVGHGKVVLLDSTVSLVHFMIWGIKFDVDSIPLVYLRDVSLNGVLVNGQKIGRNQTVLLYEGDVIEIIYVAAFMFRALEEEQCLQVVSGKGHNKTIKDWTISNRILGSGSFGSVYVASFGTEKKKFAVKVIKSSKCSNDSSLRRERFRNEAEILLKIDHVCLPFSFIKNQSLESAKY